MKLTSLRFGVKQTFRSIRQNALMSLASILTVALSLLVVGIFGLIAVNLDHIASSAEKQVEVTAFIKDDLAQPAVDALKARLKAVPGVTEVTFVSKEEALTRLKAVFANDPGLLAEVEEQNPLYRSFEIKTDKPDAIKPAAEAVAELPGVLRATYKQELVEKLFRITRGIRVAGMVIMVALFLAMVMIISNTIRITVFARRREIGIMKLVGATDTFIRWPFVCEGMFLGALGAVVTAVTIWICYTWAWNGLQKSLPFIPILPKQPLLLNLTILIVAAGVAIGAIGSAMSLRRFLRV
ncbi:MAG TPA: permease-like cell division protein FtsX [Bacillota bacterium]|jgi:cell division transport system permease protein